MATARYEITRGTVVFRGQNLGPGRVVELDEAEGDRLASGPSAVLRRVEQDNPPEAGPGARAAQTEHAPSAGGAAGQEAPPAPKPPRKNPKKATT